MFSSVGDGSDGSGGSGGDGNNKNNDNNLGDFLDPMKKPDSEDMKRAREFMSETSLPISFDSVGGSNAHEENADDANNNDIDIDGDIDDIDGGTASSNDDDDDDDLKAEGSSSISTNAPAADSSSSLVSQSSSQSSLGNATSSALFGGAEKLAKNPYMQVVSKISPSDLIAKFTAESDPRVQEAVRTTILGLIGSLPKLAFETTSVTTGQRLASLVSDKRNNEFRLINDQ